MPNERGIPLRVEGKSSHTNDNQKKIISKKSELYMVN